MKISEKTLELNVGAELLNLYRIDCGWSKTYLQGLTQRQESQKGVDFFAQLSPDVHIAAFQFKAPRGTDDLIPYKFRIQEKQHSNLRRLAKRYKKSVYYVLPFYASHCKLQKDLPHLLHRDTRFLPVEHMETSDVFGDLKSRTVRCDRSYAYINPEYRLFNVRQLEGLFTEAGIPVREFVNWYYESLRLPESHHEVETSQLQRKNPWLFRGLKVVIIGK